jgi:glycosyltransferase involved in cell wall biosynthesis
VQDGTTGLLVPPGDSAALATALARVIGDPDAGRRMGQTAQAFVRPRFGVEQYVDAVSRLYDRLLAARGLV